MEIKIKTPYIQLQQLLKLAGWISTGGEAKIAVRKLRISVNGVAEDRRGRKLYPGDAVAIQDQKYEVTE